MQVIIDEAFAQDHGTTLESIAGAHRLTLTTDDNDNPIAVVGSRRDLDRISRALVRRSPVSQAARDAAPRATERQLVYIRSLIARGADTEGGFMAVPDDLSTLTRKGASALIDSLTGNY